jgi:hypothetical protein
VGIAASKRWSLLAVSNKQRLSDTPIEQTVALPTAPPRPYASKRGRTGGVSSCFSDNGTILRRAPDVPPSFGLAQVGSSGTCRTAAAPDTMAPEDKPMPTCSALEGNAPFSSGHGCNQNRTAGAIGNCHGASEPIYDEHKTSDPSSLIPPCRFDPWERRPTISGPCRDGGCAKLSYALLSVRCQWCFLRRGHHYPPNRIERAFRVMRG